jgi:arabinose-5-phosphate isomerase
VVTGIGKSGHIARKIAATFASTGMPSFFVHPAEASHGDLGMVMKDDAVLALSNSGEASELSDIVAYTRRFSIPLIAITSRGASTLGAQADIVLEIPQAEEACPLGLAPTSSTTMMIALGDALAVALLKQRGFTATDYKQLHPGGKLGKKLLLVHEIMHKGDAVPLAADNAMMSEVIVTMTQKTFGCCGILDSAQKLIGIVTDGDLRRNMGDALLKKPASDIMTRAPKTIGPQALAAEALGRMNEKKVTSLFVIDEGMKVLGIIRMHDLLKEGVG